MSSVTSTPSYARSDTPNAAPAEARYLGLPLSAWIQMGAIASVMAVLFWPNLRRLLLKTNPFTGEANWGHSIVIPIVGIYYLFVNRDELLRAKVTPAWTGLLILIAGILIAGYGIYPGRNDTLWDYGMVVTLFGAVLLICGWQVMKVAWFPIVFLFAAVPFPGLVYSKMAMPLQNIAANVAVQTLTMTGVEANVQGTKIVMGSALTGDLRTLNVAEACAGLRSLMTFISVAAAIAFLSSRPMWQKLVITASAVPIAITCNVARISGQGLLDHYVSQEISAGFAHQFVGLAMLIPAFFLILLVGWILDRIFVEEVSAPEPAKNVVRRKTPRRRPPASNTGAGMGVGVVGSTAPDAPRRSLGGDVPA